jgi:hypothetical protein
MPSLAEIAKLRSLEEFWQLTARDLRDQLKERLRSAESATGQAAFQGVQGLASPAQAAVTAPQLFDLPGLKGHADVDTSGLVTIHIPGTDISVDNNGLVSYGIPGTSFQISGSGEILLNYYQVSQQALAQHGVDVIYQIWDRYINYDHFMAGWDLASKLIGSAVNGFYNAAESASARYYAQARIAAGHSPVTIPGVSLDPQQLETTVHAMGPGQFFHYLGGGADAQSAGEMARSGFGGASSRLIMQGGRDAVARAAIDDPLAEGWERVLEPGACGFCSMLAGRGGVYTEASAGFQAHDHDHCVARPVFAGQKSVNAELSDEWAAATKGKHGAAAISAWEDYWAGKNEQPDKRSAGEAPQDGARDGPEPGQPE